ncbi:UDP-3-O-(3-hydroxymyristoyl)glucosamine N-acyltransferase [Caldithrix abyssi]
MKLKEIADALKGELHGPGDLEITGPGKIDEAAPGQITFLANPKYQKYIASTRASAIVIDKPIEELALPYILVANAYVAFMQILRLFTPPQHDYFAGISQQAVVDPTAQIDPSAKIAPQAYIGPNVKIGKNTVIYPGVVILKNVQIGDDCVLYPHVSVREDCVIGNRVILHNGVVIGSDGFGFAPFNGAYHKIPQIGNVIIEDDVEIGANSTIDRATTGSTVIHRGCKIDNLVQIAHNVKVGDHTAIAAQTGIAGSVEIGKNVVIAGQVGIVGHIKIHDKVIVAAKSGISKDVPEGEIVFGSPALPMGKQKRIEASMRRLPELIKRVRDLEEELNALKEALKRKE